jgi:hypothetical protein
MRRELPDTVARPEARSGYFVIYHDGYSIGCPDRRVDFATYREAIAAIAEAKSNGQTAWGPFDDELDV